VFLIEKPETSSEEAGFAPSSERVAWLLLAKSQAK